MEVYAGLVWVAPGTVYPPHGHHATEIYHVIKGRAQWGPSPGHLTVRGPGDVLVHQPGQPHMMVVPQDQYLLTVYAWTGDINGRLEVWTLCLVSDKISASYWWCEGEGGQEVV